MCSLVNLTSKPSDVILKLANSFWNIVVFFSKASFHDIHFKYIPPYACQHSCRFIRCWDAKLGNEIYRITAGLGGLGSGPDLCIWSLLALR